MSSQVIDKDKVGDLLRELLATHQVVAPVRRNGLVSFEALEHENDVCLDFNNSKRLPKEAFFPRSETLFTFVGDEVEPVLLPEGNRVLFGVRPCDARSLNLLDLVFGESEAEDPYYLKRRESTVVVGLGCHRPQSTCFCSAVGGGPFNTDGLDVLLTDLGDRYLVESVTESGAVWVSEGQHLGEATGSDSAQKAEVAARGEEAVSGPDLAGVKERLDTMYDDGFWDVLHRKCLGCGACTYLCPTCHCFDIVDETLGASGRRVRTWDTCQFSLFTLHTSGHNPRPSGKERMRQRVMHKFRYFVENFGETACVGCGRCVRECPVNLDIRAVVQAITTS